MSLSKRRSMNCEDCLRGESPLLGDAEWEFITDVKNLIIQEAKSRSNSSARGQRTDLRVKLSVMKSNFNEIARYLKESTQSTEYFLSNYPQWKEFRDRTTSQLDDITNSIDKSKNDFAATKQTGNSLAVIGGLLCLATGAGAIGLAAKVMFGVGSVGSIAASVSEINQLKKMIKETEQIIEDDKVYSERLWQWISDANRIQNALDNIRNIGIDFNITAADLHASFKNKSTPEELKMVIERAVKSLNVSPEITIEISDVIGILLSISMLTYRYRTLFNQVLEASKSYKELNCCHFANGIACHTSAFVLFNSSQMSKMFFDLALNAMDYLATKYESTSEKAEDIVNATKNLKAEAKIFQELYVKMVQMSCPKVLVH